MILRAIILAMVISVVCFWIPLAAVVALVHCHYN